VRFRVKLTPFSEGEILLESFIKGETVEAAGLILYLATTSLIYYSSPFQSPLPFTVRVSL
jgi:hypothetical protein